jgi:hypothetical protein
MGRGSQLITVWVALLAGLVSRADGDDSSPDIPKAVVLKAGKRHYVVIAPPTVRSPSAPADSVLHKATVYFGDGKTMYLQGTAGSGWTARNSAGPERVSMFDLRFRMSEEIQYDNHKYTLVCSDLSVNETRTFNLEAVSESVAKSVLEKATFTKKLPNYLPWLLARDLNGTTYYLVDQPAANLTEKTFRVFVGKSGAMKQLPLKELANDASSAVFVTKQGTLVIRKAKRPEKGVIIPPTATFGKTDATQKPLEVLTLDENRPFIFGDLGVYVKGDSGIICHDL